MNILFVLTSHDTLGNTGKKTGFWIEEFANPYYTLLDKGADITLATPKGAIFYPGGHGPLWDLANDATSIGLIENFNKQKKPIAFVCHAPAALKGVKNEDGSPLVNGKKVTGFTNSEEEAVQLTSVVPFLVEDMLKANGGIYSKESDWTPYAVQDGNLITGQNPASSELVAEKLLASLN